MGKIVTDHLGNEFESLSAMARAYGMSDRTLRGRLQRGWTLERSLTESINLNRAITKYGGRKPKDELIGTKHGLLTVIREVESTVVCGQKTRQFECQCTCGNVTRVAIGNLRRNLTQSCGCLSASLTSQRHLDDLSGCVIGTLTVHERVGNTKAGSPIWRCTCECGREAMVSSQGLRYDTYPSCGCHTMSQGELAVRAYLDKHNIKYIHNHSIYDVFSTKDNSVRRLRFDYIIIKNDDTNGRVNLIGCIEFDGEQHFKPWHQGTFTDFQESAKRDALKNSFCAKHYIPLLRIRYDQAQDINKCLKIFFAAPSSYTKNHINPFLTKEEYYSPLLLHENQFVGVQSQNRTVRDFSGNEFSSIEEMCQHYGMRYKTYYDRLKQGWSLEQALTTPLHTRINQDKHILPIDFRGQEYDSVLDMCLAYNISYPVFYRRVYLGWTLERALTEPIKRKSL